jgi:hypothetical protein
MRRQPPSREPNFKLAHYRAATKKAGPESPASRVSQEPKLWGRGKGEASFGSEAHNSERPGKFNQGALRTRGLRRLRSKAAPGTCMSGPLCLRGSEVSFRQAGNLARHD